MAEGVLDGILGGEEEAPETEAASEALAGADAFAAALAADHAKYDPAVAAAAADFLRDQSQLLREQTAQLNDERPLRLSHLRHQSQESHLRRVGQRLRLAMQVFTALIVTALGLGVLVMIADAFSAKSVIVQPFNAPPARAARGLSGTVIASGLLDELTRLQAATRGSIAKRDLSDSWSDDIKVDVPETGVSIGDVDRMLKARFGHDIHIGGDLIQTDAGLALTVRGDGIIPKLFTGGAGDLDKLTVQAAEYIYGQSQPALYATYLANAGRNAEAVAFSKSTFAAAKPEDRPYILNEWANSLANIGGAPQDALALYREALKLKPDYWAAYNNVMNAEWILGEEEAVWRAGEAMRGQAGGRPGRAPEIYYENVDATTWNLQAWRAAVIADAQTQGGIGTGAVSDGPSIADVDQRLHDPADAEFQLQTTRGDSTDPTIDAMAHFVHGRMAAEAGDAQRAAAELEAFGAAFANPIVATNAPGYVCWLAPAEEAAGHPDKADAALKAGGHYLDCYRFHADILDHRGDWAGARQAYAAAVALAPDLPAGYYSWGLALARHGDPAGAIAKLTAANLRGPHWADPLKAWGDVLAGQGRWKDALAKYDEALKYAPAWAALHRARDLASLRVG